MQGTDITKHYDNPFCACKECREIKGHEIIRNRFVEPEVSKIALDLDALEIMSPNYEIRKDVYGLYCVRMNIGVYYYSYKLKREMSY